MRQVVVLGAVALLLMAWPLPTEGGNDYPGGGGLGPGGAGTALPGGCAPTSDSGVSCLLTAVVAAEAGASAYFLEYGPGTANSVVRTVTPTLIPTINPALLYPSAVQPVGSPVLAGTIWITPTPLPFLR